MDEDGFRELDYCDFDEAEEQLITTTSTEDAPHSHYYCECGREMEEFWDIEKFAFVRWCEKCDITEDV